MVRSHQTRRPVLEALEGRQVMSVGFSATVYTAPAGAGTATITLQHLSSATGSMAAEQVTVATAPGGTAVAGVDYTPVNQVVNLSATQGSATVTVPVLSGGPAGTRVVPLTITPAQSASPTGAAYLYIEDGPDTTQPTVVEAHGVTKGGSVTAFVITFSKDMIPGPANDVNNYAVLDPRSMKGRQGYKFATRTIPLKSAVYDPTTHSVTLTPEVRVRKYPVFLITDPTMSRVMAQAAEALVTRTPFSPASLPLATLPALTDTSGNPLAGLVATASVGKAGAKLTSQLNQTMPTSQG
jgi:hypothetical protein